MRGEIAQAKYQQNIVKLDVRVGDENTAVDKLKAKLKDEQYYLDKRGPETGYIIQTLLKIGIFLYLLPLHPEIAFVLQLNKCQNKKPYKLYA